jgi:hypothetical protein
MLQKVIKIKMTIDKGRELRVLHNNFFYTMSIEHGYIWNKGWFVGLIKIYGPTTC